MREARIKESINSRYQIPMLEKGFDILELLTFHRSGLTMQEIINYLNQPKTTVFRLLISLQQMGYIAKNEDNSHYYLSKKLLRLGLAALGESNIVEQSLPPMRQLRDQIKESVMLGVLMEHRVVLLEQVLGSYEFTFLLRPGTCFNLHASAPGKLFLAYSPPCEQVELLKTVDFEKYTEYTILTEATMRQEIAQIIRDGYAVDVAEEIAGVHCLAAPIFNQFGSITAVLWTSGPSGRMPQSLFSNLSEHLKKTAFKISSHLGYQPQL